MALGRDSCVDGLESGALVVGILNGELDIASTIIEEQDAGSLAVNVAAPAEQGLELLQEMIDGAAQVFE